MKSKCASRYQSQNSEVNISHSLTTSEWCSSFKLVFLSHITRLQTQIGNSSLQKEFPLFLVATYPSILVILICKKLLDAASFAVIIFVITTITNNIVNKTCYALRGNLIRSHKNATHFEKVDILYVRFHWLPMTIEVGRKGSRLFASYSKNVGTSKYTSNNRMETSKQKNIRFGRGQRIYYSSRMFYTEELSTRPKWAYGFEKKKRKASFE